MITGSSDKGDLPKGPESRPGYQPTWDDLAWSQLRLPRFEITSEGSLTRVLASPKPPRSHTRFFWCVALLAVAGSLWIAIAGLRAGNPMMTTGGFAALFWIPLMALMPAIAVAHNAHASESSRGDLLRIDHAAGSITLPRLNRSFPLDQVKAIEVIQWHVRKYRWDDDEFKCVDIVLRVQPAERCEWIRFGCKPMLTDLQLIRLASLIGCELDRPYLGALEINHPDGQAIGYF